MLLLVRPSVLLLVRPSVLLVSSCPVCMRVCAGLGAGSRLLRTYPNHSSAREALLTLAWNAGGWGLKVAAAQLFSKVAATPTVMQLAASPRAKSRLSRPRLFSRAVHHPGWGAAASHQP